MLSFGEMINDVDECNKIAALLDEAGIPRNMRMPLTLSERVAEALARLKVAQGRVVDS